MNVGTVVLKIAGRDAGRIGVVLEKKDDKILIDGQVRRREVSTNHVEPTGQTIEVAQGASSESARQALESIGVAFPEPFANKRERKGGPRPVKQRASDKKAAQKPKKSEKKPKSDSGSKDAKSDSSKKTSPKKNE